ncbi:MFS transporter [Corynebacterium sp. YIM 101645]|uniref:MFS transporter n=1 Tax=Corynebacterium lemuris TaxID=1859292 RepID=A0ABT2FYQ9_9CORY|nr:MFS transporter [Corynebacterium lemuris]MCS5480366.1 MFS transporter [Corynebacterium lemuris]
MSTSRTQRSPHIQTTPTQSDRRHTRRAWTVVALLVVFQIIAFADKAVLGLVAPDAMAELGLTPTEFGFIGSAFFFLYSIVSILTGVIASRVSVHWIVLTLGIVWAVMQFPMLLGGGAAVLLATRIILGGAEGPATAMSLTSAHTWFAPSARALPSNLIAIGSTMGPVIAAPALVFVISMWGWRWAFGAMGIVGLIWCVTWILFGGSGPYLAKNKAQNAEDASPQENDAVADSADSAAAATPSVDDRPTFAIWKVLLSLSFIATLIGASSSFFVQGFLTTWLPQYLTTVVGLSLPQVGVVTTFPWVIGAIVLLVLGGVGHRLMLRGRTVRLAIASLFGLSILLSGIFFLLATATSGNVSVLFLCLAGGFSLVYPMSATAVGYCVGVKQRPIIMATLGGLAATGAIVSPMLVGQLMTRAGYAAPPKGVAPSPEMVTAMTTGIHSAFIIAGIFLIIGGAMCILFLRPERTAERLQRIHLQDQPQI